MPGVIREPIIDFLQPSAAKRPLRNISIIERVPSMEAEIQTVRDRDRGIGHCGRSVGGWIQAIAISSPCDSFVDARCKSMDQVAGRFFEYSFKTQSQIEEHP